MDTLWQDVRYALRALRGNPGFTAVAVLTLALGIGANSAVFSTVYSLLFNPLPFARSDGLVAVWEVGPQGNDHTEVSPANFRDYRAAARSFANLVAHAWWPANLTGGDAPERVQGFRVSPEYFATLGVRPLLGRAFAPGEDQPGRDRVILLSHGLWQRRFGGDTTVVGRTVAVNGIERTVIGVLPPRVAYPAPGEVWAPLALDSAGWERRGARYLLVTGRLAPGATLEGAQAELATLARRLADTYTETNARWSANVQPLAQDAVRMLEPVLLLLFGAVGFVLLIACVNVANLLLARGTHRRREFALRATLGARPGRLVRQALTESVVLALLGGAAGVVVALWGITLLTGLVPEEHQRFLLGFDRIGINGAVLAFTAAMAVLTAMLFGLVPALRAAEPDLQGVLQAGDRAGGGPSRHRLRRALVGAEVTLALLLLAGAGLMFRGMRALLATPPGFEPDSVALTSIALPPFRYESPEQATAFYRDLLARVTALPGVRAAGAANVTPLCLCNQTTSFAIVGAEPFRPGEGPDVGERVVTPGYFAALGVPMVAGRGFADTDGPDQPRVIVINQTLARRHFPGGAIGRRIRFGESDPFEIVGIVGDVRHDGPARPPQPELYFPAAQQPRWEMTLAVRAADPRAVLPAIRAAVRAVDPDQPVADQRTMRDALAAALGPYRLALRVLGGLGALALALAAVGIYAVIAQLVSERTREIGIRLALGGEPAAVRALVLRQGVAPAAWGTAVGVGLAAVAAQLLAAQFVGVRARDPGTLLVVASALLVVALLAAYLPARRATHVDPLSALRTE
jgi:predicted permease